MRSGYATYFVADKRTVSLVEISSSEQERTVRVAISPSAEWQLVLPVWYLPRVAILGTGAVVVWSGRRFFLLWEGEEPIHGELDDEIHVIYGVDGRLCIVGELSVVLYDPTRAIVVDRWEAGDVLGTTWWEGDTLVVESAAGTSVRFRPTSKDVGYIER